MARSEELKPLGRGWRGCSTWKSSLQSPECDPSHPEAGDPLEVFIQCRVPALFLSPDLEAAWEMLGDVSPSVSTPKSDRDLVERS